MFDGKSTVQERVATFVGEMLAFWGRARPFIEKALLDVHKVPVLAARQEQLGGMLEQLARLALGEAAEDGDFLQLMVALTEFSVWCALADHRFESQATKIGTDIILSRISRLGGEKEA